jgi:hypothetical protein
MSFQKLLSHVLEPANIEDQEIKAMWSVVELEAEDEASNAYHRLSRPQ